MNGLNRSFNAALASVAGALAAIGGFGRYMSQSGCKMTHYHRAPTRKHKFDKAPARRGVKTLDLQQYEKRYSHCMSGVRR